MNENILYCISYDTTHVPVTFICVVGERISYGGGGGVWVIERKWSGKLSVLRRSNAVLVCSSYYLFQIDVCIDYAFPL